MCIMPPPQRRRRHALEQKSQRSSNETTPLKPIGRPKGAPSTILNLRLPLDLLAQLDRYLDDLEVHTGLKANRGMIARRALALFLETHPLGDNMPRMSGGKR
jgi:hypothetical protein